MAITNNIQWKRISAEGAAIVVSILLAFSIQAWWDERQNIEDEQVILAALVDEFKVKKKYPEDSSRFQSGNFGVD